MAAGLCDSRWHHYMSFLMPTASICAVSKFVCLFMPSSPDQSAPPLSLSPAVEYACERKFKTKVCCHVHWLSSQLLSPMHYLQIPLFSWKEHRYFIFDCVKNVHKIQNYNAALGICQRRCHTQCFRKKNWTTFDVLMLGAVDGVAPSNSNARIS